MAEQTRERAAERLRKGDVVQINDDVAWRVEVKRTEDVTGLVAIDFVWEEPGEGDPIVTHLYRPDEMLRLR